MVCLFKLPGNIKNWFIETYRILFVFCFFYCPVKVWKTFDICGKDPHTLVSNYSLSTQKHTFFYWHAIFNVSGSIVKIMKANITQNNCYGF